MYAVFTATVISDFDAARKSLHDEVIPRVSQAPGFVSGVWLAPESGSGEGNAMVVFESEEAARAAAERISAQPPANVEFSRIEVREVAGRV